MDTATLSVNEEKSCRELPPEEDLQQFFSDIGISLVDKRYADSEWDYRYPSIDEVLRELMQNPGGHFPITPTEGGAYVRIGNTRQLLDSICWNRDAGVYIVVRPDCNLWGEELVGMTIVELRIAIGGMSGPLRPGQRAWWLPESPVEKRGWRLFFHQF